MGFTFALIVFAGMFGLALFWSAWLSLESPVRRPRLRLQGAALILAYVLLVAFQPWLAACFPEPRTEALDEALASWHLLQLVVLVVLVGPVVEEYLFRWVMLHGVSRRFGLLAGCVASTATWVAMHGQYDPFSLLVYTITGLLLGATVIETRSLVPATLLHMANNAIALAERCAGTVGHCVG